MKTLRMLLFVLLAASCCLQPTAFALVEDSGLVEPESLAEITTPEMAAEVFTSDNPAVVYVIPIKDMIEPALLYVVRRGVAEAQREKADAIVFVMDTPGGTLDAATEIVRTIRGISVPTYTFVENEAFSAGAIIALATKNIYMAPGSVIGDAMPIMMTPIGSPQEVPAGLKEKVNSAVSALIRSAAEQGGHDTELAEAMVRPEAEYKIDDEVISKKDEVLTLTNVEAARLVGQDLRPLLSSGTVTDLGEMLETIGMEEARIKELTVTAAEHVARFVAGFAPLFLIIGLVGIWIEVKTPGFGLPGIIGAVSLAVFFWGHHIAGLAGMEDFVIFLIGVILLLLEILVIPGFGIAGITGIALITWALLSAMLRHYPGMPWYAPSWEDFPIAFLKLCGGLVGAAAVAMVLAKYLPKTKTFNRLVLAEATSSTRGFTASRDTADLIGLIGTALTPLRPGGTGLFDERRLDTVTRGDFIDAGAKIRVVETHGNRIIVEACEGDESKEEKS